MKSGQRCYPSQDMCRLRGMTRLAQERCVHLAVERSSVWGVEKLRELFGMQLGWIRLWNVIQQGGIRSRHGLRNSGRRSLKRLGGRWDDECE
jgi:hypothetical protein